MKLERQADVERPSSSRYDAETPTDEAQSHNNRAAFTDLIDSDGLEEVVLSTKEIDAILPRNWTSEKSWNILTSRYGENLLKPTSVSFTTYICPETVSCEA